MTFRRSTPKLLLALTLLLTGCVTAPQRGGSPVHAVRQVLETQALAWNRGDIDGFVRGYWRSPQLVFISPDGVELGYDDMVARYRRRYPDAAAMGRLSFGGIGVWPLGDDHALVRGTWHLERESDELSGHFALVMRKFPSGWLIVSDYTTSDEVPEAPAAHE